jgi:hypothetical protein
MKRLFVALFVSALSFTLVVGNAEAKCVGGGNSAGMQCDGVAQKHQASLQPGAPAQNSSAFLAAAVSFDEAWNLVKPTESNRGWQLAGIQQIP